MMAWCLEYLQFKLIKMYPPDKRSLQQIRRDIQEARKANLQVPKDRKKRPKRR